MAEQASFSIPVGAHGGETTGRYVVTFRDEGTTAGLAALRKKTPIRRGDKRRRLQRVGDGRV